MSLIVAHDQNAFVHAGAYDLEAKLVEMDPRLYLKYRVVQHPKKGTGRRYEVHRHCEDGETRLIGHWRIEEFDQIWTDMQVMKAGAEGRIDGVEARIDAHNDAVDSVKSSEFRDAVGPMLDHAARLTAERQSGKHIHYQVGGLRDDG